MRYLRSILNGWNYIILRKSIIIALFLIIFTGSFNFLIQGMEVKGAMSEYTFRDFYVDEPTIYTTRDESTLFVLNNSDFQQLEIIGEQTNPVSYRGFLLKHNDYLVLFRSEHYFGQTPEYLHFLEFIDVSDVTNPVFISETQLPNSYVIVEPRDFHSRGVMTIENKLYLFIHATYNNHFLCINLTDISHPELLEYNNFPGEAGASYDHYKRFFIRENNIFLPTKNNSFYGFVAYNFTSLQALTKVTEWFGNINLTSFDSIYTSQDFVFLKDDEAFIEIFNIQNFTNPKRKGYINLGSSLYTTFRGNHLITFYGDLLYPNLTVIDFSNITDLKITSNYSHPGDALGIFNFNVFTESMFTDTLIYIPIQMTQYKDKMLYVLDWSDPYNLFVKATLGFPFPSTDGFPINSISFLLVTMICVTVFVKVKYNKKVK